MLIKKIFQWISILVVLLIVSMGLAIFYLPAPPLLENIGSSVALFDANHQLLRLTLSPDGKYRLLTRLSAISPLVVEATLLQEDQYFRWHFGMNPFSLLRACWTTYIRAKHRLGASTISMQVARLRYGLHSKTVLGKFKQIVRALQLEAHYSKNAILEAYLNLAPYGNNVEGIGAASLIYFNRPPQSLHVSEILSLVVIPQNPNQRLLHPEQLIAARTKLFKRWLLKHPEDRQQAPLFNLPLAMRNIRDLPFLAPHFVNEVLAHLQPQAHAYQLVTSLDLKWQQSIERITHAYMKRQALVGVDNAAILLIDARSNSVKALVGSNNFFSKKINGQVNGTNIKRSPGSTLKPFIYALALDQGLIHPASILKDTPYQFGSYNPENFDSDFMGPIQAKTALILSRNIPAIYLAQQLRPSLYTFLQQAQISHLQAETHYGLSLALGGAEISMQELVSLYALFLNQGVWHSLQWQQTSLHAASSLVSPALFSPEAGFLVLDMLKDSPPPFATQLSAAFKTGTSSAYRDAWTVGVFGPYVLAVWLGNFNGKSNPALIGKKIAAPLFFEILQAMHSQSKAEVAPISSSKGLHLAQVEICKASGMLPRRTCPLREKTWFIPGKSPIQLDTVYREIAIDNQTGLRACHFNQGIHFAVYEFWPSDSLAVFKRAGIKRRTPPPYAKNCSIQLKSREGLAPQIISPIAKEHYILRTDVKNKTIIPFMAIVDADASRVHWFINQIYLGQSKPNQAFLWQAQPGHFIVRAVDDAGRSDAEEIKVQLY
jgi:penicillin-binding protein 1C